MSFLKKLLVCLFILDRKADDGWRSVNYHGTPLYKLIGDSSSGGHGPGGSGGGAGSGSHKVAKSSNAAPGVGGAMSSSSASALAKSKGSPQQASPQGGPGKYCCKGVLP